MESKDEDIEDSDRKKRVKAMHKSFKHLSKLVNKPIKPEYDKEKE